MRRIWEREVLAPKTTRVVCLTLSLSRAVVAASTTRGATMRFGKSIKDLRIVASMVRQVANSSVSIPLKPQYSTSGAPLHTVRIMISSTLLWTTSSQASKTCLRSRCSTCHSLEPRNTLARHSICAELSRVRIRTVSLIK